MSDHREHHYGKHTQAPAHPSNGDKFACSCGIAYEYVVLDDGLPGEWVQVAGD